MPRPRLHKVYDREAFDDRLLELTLRLVKAKPWIHPAGGERLLKTWLHGACLIYEIPEPELEIRRTPSRVGEYIPDSLGSGTIRLHQVSMVSLFHNFRHHMQEHAEMETNNQEGYEDAQAWACSLFYNVAPRRFRRMVRAGRIAGVHPDDLLKRKAAA